MLPPCARLPARQQGRLVGVVPVPQRALMYANGIANETRRNRGDAVRRKRRTPLLLTVTEGAEGPPGHLVLMLVLRQRSDIQLDDGQVIRGRPGAVPDLHPPR